jgi:hypothetical protein
VGCWKWEVEGGGGGGMWKGEGRREVEGGGMWSGDVEGGMWSGDVEGGEVEGEGGGTGSIPVFGPFFFYSTTYAPRITYSRSAKT